MKWSGNASWKEVVIEGVYGKASVSGRNHNNIYKEIKVREGVHD